MNFLIAELQVIISKEPDNGDGGYPADEEREREREREPVKQFLLRVPLTWSWHLSAGYWRGEAQRGGDGFKLHRGVIIQPLGWLRTQIAQLSQTKD